MRGTPFSTGNAGTTSVSVTVNAVGNKTPFLTGIQASSDAAAVVTVESPTGTTIWYKRFAAAFAFSDTFQTPVKGVPGGALVVKVSAGTSHCEIDAQGYLL